MAEIDLIPVDYRDRLLQQSVLRNYLVGILAVIALIGASGFAVGRSAQQMQARVAKLKAESAITQQQQAQLEELRQQQAEYERRWSLLRGLRAGAAIDETIAAARKVFATL